MRFQLMAPEQSRQQDCLVDHFDVNHAFANGAGDGGAEDEGGDEIPEGGPGDGAKRCENARGDDGGDGVGGVVPAVGKLESECEGYNDDKEVEAIHGRRPREKRLRRNWKRSKKYGRQTRLRRTARREETRRRGQEDEVLLGHEAAREASWALSSALENDAFDDVGDVFALVDGGFDDLEDFFPLDDLDRVRLFVEKLGDEGAAEAVAFVFVAIDFDAVLEGFFRRFEGVDARRRLRRWRRQGL